MGILAPTASAAPGDLDAGFGSKGLVHNGSVGRSSALVDGDRLVILSDGHIEHAVEVRRLLPNGELDRHFGANGKTFVKLPGMRTFGDSLSVDGQGRILLGISAQDEASHATYLRIARLKPGGTLDRSFAGDGISDPIGLSSAQDMSVDSKGRVLFTALVRDGDVYEYDVGRLTATGALDQGFGVDGLALIDPPTPGRYFGVGAIEVGPKDAVFVGGRLGLDAEPLYGKASVMKFDSSGTMDTAYGTDGVGVVGDIGLRGVADMKIGPDGSAYVASGRLRRLTVTGELDPSYKPNLDYNQRGAALALTRNGSLLEAQPGVPGMGYRDMIQIVRIGESGELDRGFGRNGRTYIYAANQGMSFDGRIPPVMSASRESIALTAPGSTAKLTLAPGKGNSDADGFGNSEDRCRWLPADDHRGCLVYERSARIYGFHRALEGYVKSWWPACVDHARVEVYRRAHIGRDQFVAKMRTASDGSWVIEDDPKPGRYYFTASRSSEGGKGICLGTRSAPDRSG